MVNVLNCNIIVSEFEIQLCYNIHFRTNTIAKGRIPPILLRARETGIRSQVESYHKLKKMVLDASLRNTQYYKFRVMCK